MEAMPKYSPECHLAGCVQAFRCQDHRLFYVHDGLGRYSMVEITEEDLNNLEVDIWGDQVKPWIKQLHREATGA